MAKVRNEPRDTQAGKPPPCQQQCKTLPLRSCHHCPSGTVLVVSGAVLGARFQTTLRLCKTIPSHRGWSTWAAQSSDDTQPSTECGAERSPLGALGGWRLLARHVTARSLGTLARLFRGLKPRISAGCAWRGFSRCGLWHDVGFRVVGCTLRPRHNASDTCARAQVSHVSEDMMWRASVGWRKNSICM